MRGWTGPKGFAGVLVAVALVAGLLVAIVLIADRSPFSSPSPRMARADTPQESKPISADLAAAIRNGDARIVRELLAQGADVNARDEDGNTPLILASFYAG